MFKHWLVCSSVLNSIEPYIIRTQLDVKSHGIPPVTWKRPIHILAQNQKPRKVLGYFAFCVTKIDPYHGSPFGLRANLSGTAKATQSIVSQKKRVYPFLVPIARHKCDANRNIFWFVSMVDTQKSPFLPSFVCRRSNLVWLSASRHTNVFLTNRSPGMDPLLSCMTESPVSWSFILALYKFLSVRSSSSLSSLAPPTTFSSQQNK